MSCDPNAVISSQALSDLNKDIQTIDEVVESNLDTTTTKDGKVINTLEGQLKLLGYQTPVVYAAAIEFTSNDNTKTIERNKVIYAPLPSAIPFTTSGTWTADDEDKFFVVQGLTTESSEIVLSANSVADMKTKDLQPGQNIETQEFYPGTGGGTEYNIELGDSSNGFNRILLNNGNTAVLKQIGVINAAQLGARADDSTDNWPVLNFAVANYKDIDWPAGVSRFDFVANGSITKTSSCRIRGAGIVSWKWYHTTTDTYAMELGGAFGNDASFLDSINITNYDDAAYTQQSYIWDAAGSSGGTFYGAFYSSGNRENGILLGASANAVIGQAIKNCQIKGFDGTAVTFGSGTNHIVKDSDIRDSKRNINIKDTFGSFKITLMTIQDSYVHRGARQISNTDNSGVVHGAVSGLIVKNTALDNCNYPIELLSDTGFNNAYISIDTPWVEGNEFNGLCQIREYGQLENIVNIDGTVDLVAELGQDAFISDSSARGVAYTGINSQVVSICRGSGYEKIVLEELSLDSPSDPTVKWNGSNSGFYRRNTNEFGWSIDGIGALYPTIDGSFGIFLETDRNNMSINAKDNAGLQIDDGVNLYATILSRSDVGVRFYPDNTLSDGTPSLRSSVVYSGTGTINTSDEREKTKLEDLSLQEKAVASELKSCIKKFKWLESIDRKDDKARWHFGVGAQTVKSIFEKHGLDGFEYGCLCYDEWEDEFEDILDNKGKPTGERKLLTSAGDRYGVRPDQILYLIISVM